MKARSNKAKDIWTLVLSLDQKLWWQTNKNSEILSKLFHNQVIKQVYSHQEAQSDLLSVLHLVLELSGRVNMVMDLFGRQDSQCKAENLEEQIEIMTVLLLDKVLGLLLNWWTEGWCLFKLMKNLLLQPAGLIAIKTIMDNKV